MIHTELRIASEMSELIRECEVERDNIQHRIDCLKYALSALTGVPVEEFESNNPITAVNKEIESIKHYQVFCDRICKNCGKQFTPVNSRQQFCQKSCNPKAFKKKLKVQQNPSIQQKSGSSYSQRKLAMNYLKPLPKSLPT